jgi:GTP pyrophosphokinase
MTSLENRANIEEVLAEFEGKKDVLEALCAKTKSLIEASLQDARIHFHSVQTRVKSREKIKAKYLDPEKDYGKLNDITDLAGLRIITYYADDVDRVVEVLKREFDIDPKNSVDKRRAEPDRFGYSAVNLVCKHLEKREVDVEYKKFAGIFCEVQITSILSHAWSEIEHEWYDLRDAYPDDIKREFSRLSALFELADSKFLDIRKARRQYERSVAVQVEAKVPNLPVDPLSLKSLIDQEPLVGELDQAIAPLMRMPLVQDVPDALLEVRSIALKQAGLTTLQQVRDGLKRYRTAIPEYVGQCKKEQVWAHSPKGAQLARSISLYHLATFSMSLEGVEALSKFYEAIDVKSRWNFARQVEIAREIADKSRH